MNDVSDTAVARTGKLSLADLADHSIDASWETLTPVNGVFCNRVRITRTAVHFLGIQTGCTLDVTYSAANAQHLERVRLAYVSWLGCEVTLDDASEANDRMTSTSAVVTVSGTVPATAQRVMLCVTPDGGTEQVAVEHAIR